MSEVPNTKDHREEICAYRESLLTNAEHQIDEFGKSVMTMAAGGLGISFAFVEKIVKPENMICPGLLLLAWACWSISIGLTLWSFYSSHQANMSAVDQIDQKLAPLRGKLVPHFSDLGCDPTQISDNIRTRRFNGGAAVLFVLGTGLIVWFVGSNLLRSQPSISTVVSLTNSLPSAVRPK